MFTGNLTVGRTLRCRAAADQLTAIVPLSTPEAEIIRPPPGDNANPNRAPKDRMVNGTFARVVSVRRNSQRRSTLQRTRLGGFLLQQD